LNNNEYLLIDQKGVKQILKIKDLDLFIKCFNRFKYYITNYCSNTVERAADNCNWSVVEYLLQKKMEFHGYKLTEIACQKKNYELAVFCCDALHKSKALQMTSASGAVKKLDNVSFLEIIKNAIETKELKYVELVFEHVKDWFSKESVINKEKIIVDSLATGGVEIFRLVRKYFEDSFVPFSLKKVYNRNLVWRLFSVSVANFESYKYVYENFDLSFTTSEEPPNTVLQYPVISSVEKGCKEVVHHLLDNKLVARKFIDRMYLVALEFGHFKLYELIKDYFKKPILPLPGYNVPTMKLPSRDLDRARYAVECLGIDITEGDLIRSTESIEVFKYMYERYKGSKFKQNPQFLDQVIYGACIWNNIKVIEYLVERQVSFQGTNIWSCFVHLKRESFFEFNKLFLQTSIPNENDIQSLSLAAEYLAGKDLNSFKLAFVPLLKLTTDSSRFSQCFLNAVKGGRIATLFLLFKNGLRPINYIPLLEEAASLGDLRILHYIIKNYFKDIRSHQSILLKSIENNHLDCLKYLAPFYNIQSIFNYNFLCSLGSKGNLLIIQFLIQSTPKKPDLYPIFKTSICYPDIREYLKSIGYQEPQLDFDIF